MHWKEWLLQMCPADWTDEEALEFILILLRRVNYTRPTLDDVVAIRGEG